jgi:RimJ/RimL family protein N-acetyltransferase
MERNIGRCPTWTFPQLPPNDKLFFRRLTFDNRSHLLQMFEKDSDPWVDKRLKAGKSAYEYVAMQLIEGAYSFKRGSCDWLIYTQQDHEPAGVLHMFELSKETYTNDYRKCSVGYAIAPKFRGTGLAYEAMRHFHQYLFRKMDRLLLVAFPDRNNERSCRFLQKLGYEDRTLDYEHYDPDRPKKELKDRFFELYRSHRTRNWIHRTRAESHEKYKVWRSKWVKNPDGSYTIPND